MSKRKKIILALISIPIALSIYVVGYAIQISMTTFNTHDSRVVDCILENLTKDGKPLVDLNTPVGETVCKNVK